MASGRERPKKTPAKKTPAKKTPAKKTPAKKTPAKKTSAKKTSLSTYQKFDIAWRRIKKDRHTDFLIGDFEYRVFDRYGKALIKEVCDRYSADPLNYSPAPLRTIRVPKTRLTTRPGAVPTLPDRLVYQYLVDELAEVIEEKLIPIAEEVVHRYRYSGDRSSSQMFAEKESNHKTFVVKARQFGKTHKYVVLTDIASYFERIYHHDLENILRGLGGPTEVVDALMALLRKWQKGISYGLPQGMWPSDYLGNVYLNTVDKFMRRKGYSYCRSVDDIAIGVDTYEEGQKVLLALEKQLASVGLNLNAAKTKVVSGPKVAEVLSPHRKTLFKIFKEFRARLPKFGPYWEPDPEELEALKEEVELDKVREALRTQLEEEDPDVGVTRWLLDKLRVFEDSTARDDVLNNLPRLLVVTPKAVNYLVRIARADTGSSKTIGKALRKFMADGHVTGEWQLMWLLHGLAQIGRFENGDLDIVRALVEDHGRHSEAVVVNAVVLLGEFGDEADRDRLAQIYDDTHSTWVRTSILFAVQGLPKTKRNHFYTYCKGLDRVSDAVIQFAQEES